MEGGAANNQIPDRVRLTGTFRTLRRDVRDLVEAAICRVADGIGRTFAEEISVSIAHSVPVTTNSPAEVELAVDAAAGIGAQVRRDLPPSMAGEDFGWYLEQLPGAFAWIGNGPSRPGAELHNPGYDYNDDILPIASGWLAATARRALLG